MPTRQPRSAVRWIGVVLMLVVIAGGISIVRTLTSSARDDARRTALREQLRARRAAIDSCSAAVAARERRFRTFDRRVDSLRRTVRAYESADTAGVRADQYDRYLDAFDRHNDAVPVWHDRADSLRAHSRRCRALARRHNRFTDSLRRVFDARLERP